MKSISLNNSIINSKCSFKSCINKSLYFCINDNSHLCETCKDKYKTQLDYTCITNNEYILTAKFIKYNQLLNDSFSKDEVKHYNQKMDFNNKFIYLNDKNELMFGEKWLNCNLPDSAPYAAVSFIGNTGSGKSSTVGSLCIEDNFVFNHPIPSTTNSNSTSSDINSFLGETNDKLKYLIFDTEGLGGSLTPSTINDIDVNSEHMEKRFEIVQKIYPMLLYIVSDIIVYTFSGGPSEKYKIIESLYCISLISSSIVNKTTKPHLIILFNKQSNDMDTYCDINNATNDFYKCCTPNQIEKINDNYKSISVLYLPDINVKNSFTMYKNQLDQLKKIISDKIHNSLDYKKSNNLDISIKSNMNKISTLKNCINKNPHENINLETCGITGFFRNSLNIAQSISNVDSNNSYVPPSFQNNLITNNLSKRISSNYILYFNLCFNKYIEKNNKHSSYESALKDLKSALYPSFIKLKQRMNVNDINSFYQQFLPVLKMLSHELVDYIPCGKLIKGKYHCIVSKKTHLGKKHQSKETYEEKRGFFKGSIQLPHEDTGSYEESSQPERFDVYLINNIQVNTTSNEKPSLDIYNCFHICIGCLLEPPLLLFSCGHVLCLKCCNENYEKCGVGVCNGTLMNKKDVDFIPSMGCRILTLDGGGIRGIAECVILKTIKELLYGLEITDLFDLIVGTSTGGIIALGTAAGYIPSDIIEIFEKMATTVFNANIFKHVLSIANITSKYSDKNLRNCLFSVLQDKKLMDTFDKTRVAVTSVTETKFNSECIFINYFKGVSLDDQHRYINNATCVEAALATSAAPTYFPPFKHQGIMHYDGGLRNNNPCKIALDEYKTIWPQKKIDVFLSIGTGKFKKKSVNSNILKLANMIIDILTDSEKSWEEINKKLYMNDNDKTLINENINSFRCNPYFENDIGLDSCDGKTIETLKECYKGIDREELFKPINKLLSSLFYLSNLQWNEPTKTLSGFIKFRLKKMPSELVNQVNSNSNLFHYYKDGKVEHIVKNQDIPISGESFNLPFSIQISQVDNVDIFCDLKINYNYYNPSSISGCPFSLVESLNLYNIKLIK